MELMTMLAIAKTLVQANMAWEKKIRETKVMIYISEYLNKFPVEDNYFILNCFTSIGWIIYSICAYGSEILVLLLHEQHFVVYLKCINRLCLGYLLTGFYLRFWIDTATYIIFMRRLFDQVTREIETKIIEYELLESTKALYVLKPESNFLIKLKNLRRLYLAILESFQRTRTLYSGITEYVVLGNFLSAIWILAIICIGAVGRRQLTFSDYAIVFRFFVRASTITIFAKVSDRIQELIEHMQTVIYKVPSRKLTTEESAELETFMKLLGWEEPMKTTKDSYRFGIGSMSSLALEVLVNSMVVTQLYIFLDQQLKAS
uniref:Uncharacterized protein LOC114335798 n=1 Tax=Diabrotica virgifera virgifera TaxID=50390 RepID=A0A6P7FZ81_DIAVI